MSTLFFWRQYPIAAENFKAVKYLTNNDGATKGIFYSNNGITLSDRTSALSPSGVAVNFPPRNQVIINMGDFTGI